MDNFHSTNRACRTSRATSDAPTPSLALAAALLLAHAGAKPRHGCEAARGSRAVDDRTAPLTLLADEIRVARHRDHRDGHVEMKHPRVTIHTDRLTYDTSRAACAPRATCRS